MGWALNRSRRGLGIHVMAYENSRMKPIDGYIQLCTLWERDQPRGPGGARPLPRYTGPISCALTAAMRGVVD